MRDKSLTDLEHKFLSRTAADDSFPRFMSAIAEAGFPAWLALHDPSQNRKYVRWLAKRYLDGSIKRLEDIPSTINEALTKHMRLSQKRILLVEHRNIDRFKTPNDLMDLLDTYQDADLDSRSEVKDKEEQLFFDTGGAVLIHDDADYKIVVPKTEEASKFFGKNTRWCTAAEYHNAFEDYAGDGDLYIILHKPTNSRWQVHFQSFQFMDERDDEVDYWEFCEEHPAITPIMQPHAAAAKNLLFNDNGLTDDNDIIKLIKSGYVEALRHLDSPSEAVCLAAVQQNGYVIQCIKSPSEAVCLAAVRQNGFALMYIKNPSEAVCLAAVQQNGYAIEYIKNPSEAFCLAAVRQNGFALMYIKNPSEAVCLAAVQQNGLAIRDIKNPSKAVCMVALKQDPSLIDYIKSLYPDYSEESISYAR